MNKWVHRICQRPLVCSVWKSGPVRFFGPKGLGPRPRPVFHRALQRVTRGFLYLWFCRIIPVNFLKILSPRSSGSVENWLSYDLKLIWVTHYQNWCQGSLNMVKKSENTRILVICGYFRFFSSYLDFSLQMVMIHIVEHLTQLKRD